MLVPEIPTSKLGYIYIYLGLCVGISHRGPTLGPRVPPIPTGSWFKASAGTPSPRPIGGQCLESPQRRLGCLESPPSDFCPFWLGGDFFLKCFFLYECGVG